MFGHSYFGARYFGARYFGDGGDAEVVVEPPPQLGGVPSSWSGAHWDFLTPDEVIAAPRPAVDDSEDETLLMFVATRQ